ncbi:VOC family protein [Schaalia suimastitidis]|uniref:VOC family protein n=1 Tax=Schaalia suimastitidis TaxID=121163 RepID=UPI000412A02B|nr:VOC family protein [Schaalia suimastitidis]
MTSLSHGPTPCIWINGDAAQAARYYADIFRDVTIVDAGITSEITIHGRKLVLLGADATYAPNPSISGLLNFDPLLFGGEAQARQYLDHCYEHLSEGGVLMELGQYPFSAHYAWVKDRYGFTWQLMLTNPEGEPAPFVIPAFMFGGTNHGNCEEATDHWIATLGGERKSIVRYDDNGPLEAGSVQFTSFTLAGQWFAGMDSGTFHDFTFTPGVSMMLFTATQAGLDTYWAALSRVPEAERCGWCMDQWGVSWQVLPDTIGQLMADPITRGRLMDMGKIDLTQLEA